MEKKEKVVNAYKIVMLVILVAFITFLLTVLGMERYYSGKDETDTSAKISKSYGDLNSKLSQYKKLIDKYFLGEVDEAKLEEAAIKGYFAGLDDPYTEFISKEDMQDFMDDAKGNFVGIGVYMVKDVDANKIMVLSPIKGSPAEAAGILPGDYIVKVDGIEYSGDDMTVASNKIKGEEGTKVTIEILRENEQKTLELERAHIKVNQVESKVLENNIGYIQFTSFDEETGIDFKENFDKINAQGIKSLIIDLRNNGGGLVSEALQIADYILEKNSVMLYEVDKKGKEDVKISTSEPLINMPIIVLTNEHTASSSEILAGALKDNGKAKIVGTKTYGKGVIQQILTLLDGSGLKITTNEYLTPNRVKINKIGIEPNETVNLPETVKNAYQVTEEEDTQLKKAIEMLK